MKHETSTVTIPLAEYLAMKKELDAYKEFEKDIKRQVIRRYYNGSTLAELVSESQAVSDIAEINRYHLKINNDLSNVIGSLEKRIFELQAINEKKEKRNFWPF
jgi:vacuolar-type H+-ATPase subunit D/Vma8